MGAVTLADVFAKRDGQFESEVGLTLRQVRSALTSHAIDLAKIEESLTRANSKPASIETGFSGMIENSPVKEPNDLSYVWALTIVSS